MRKETEPAASQVALTAKGYTPLSGHHGSDGEYKTILGVYRGLVDLVCARAL